MLIRALWTRGSYEAARHACVMTRDLVNPDVYGVTRKTTATTTKFLVMSPRSDLHGEVHVSQSCRPSRHLLGFHYSIDIGLGSLNRQFHWNIAAEETSRKSPDSLHVKRGFIFLRKHDRS